MYIYHSLKYLWKKLKYIAQSIYEDWNTVTKYRAGDPSGPVFFSSFSAAKMCSSAILSSVSEIDLAGQVLNY